MFQYGDNDINSYNSVTMSQTVKGDFKPSKLYSSSKILITNEFRNKLNPTKKNILDINAKVNILSKEKVENNGNDINNNNLNKNSTLKEIDLSVKKITSNNLTKLPKITKCTIQTNSVLDKNIDSLNFNPLISTTYSIDKTINGNQNLYLTKNQIFYNEQLKNKNNSKKRKSSLRLSGVPNFESIQFHQNKILSENIKISVNKKIKIKNEPKLGKMKEYIILPDFIGDEPLTEMVFNPILEDNLIKPQNERQYEINLYLNCHKMLNNLIYLKIPLTKDGLIPTQNIINVKKLYNENKFKEDEEDINQENQKEIEKQKPVSPNEEMKSIIIQKKKPYVSISEYPGNYKPANNIRNDWEFKFSQKIINKININENNEKNIVKSTRNSINLNLYEMYKRNQNNSEIYGEKNSENYVSKSLHFKNGINFFENKTDKNENSVINKN